MQTVYSYAKRAYSASIWVTLPLFSHHFVSPSCLSYESLSFPIFTAIRKGKNKCISSLTSSGFVLANFIPEIDSTIVSTTKVSNASTPVVREPRAVPASSTILLNLTANPGVFCASSRIKFQARPSFFRASSFRAKVVCNFPEYFVQPAAHNLRSTYALKVLEELNSEQRCEVSSPRICFCNSSLQLSILLQPTVILITPTVPRLPRLPESQARLLSIRSSFYPPRRQRLTLLYEVFLASAAALHKARRNRRTNRREAHLA